MSSEASTTGRLTCGVRRWLPALVVVAAGLACAVPLPGLRLVGSCILAAVAPGWCLWSAVDASWPARRLDLRLALSVVGSAAVTPLVLYWGCYGGQLDRVRCAVVLGALCVVLAAIGQGRREPVPGASSPASRVANGLLTAGVVGFAAMVATPWLPNGAEVAGAVAQSPCSGDWSCHRSFTVAVLETGIPARNPFVCGQRLTYYYGHFIQAAALIRLSAGALTVDGALLTLSLLLAGATCALVFHLALACGASGTWAALATLATVLVSGLDILVLLGTRVLLTPILWDWGHLQVWTESPRVPFPFSNLHWAPHHHAAALLALALVWWSVTGGSSRFLQALVTGVLTAGVVVNSGYVGLVVFSALGLIATGGVWRHVTSRSGWGQPAQWAMATGLALALASGMLVDMSHMVPSFRRRIELGAPTVPYAAEALLFGLNKPLLAGVNDFATAQRRLQALATDAPGHLGQVRGAWLLAGPGRRAVNTAAGILAVIIQFGLIGVLGCLGLRRRAGPALPTLLLTLLGVAALATLVVRNYDLQMRSAGLLWLLLGVCAARGGRDAICRPLLPDLRRLVTCGLLCVAAGVGLWGAGFEVAGMSRPVYFDAGDLRVFAWVRTHTPPGSVVQAFPDTAPRVARAPRPRYFVRPSFPEFTGRCAVLGDRFHVREYTTAERFRALRDRLQAAFLAPTPQEARLRFASEGIQYVLWTSGDDSSDHAGARANLLDPSAFEVVFREGPSFVVRVRPVERKFRLIAPDRALG